jgi:hypothetical protein
MVGLSFAGWYAVAVVGQSRGAGDGTWRYWADAFPPRSIWRIPLWLVDVHTSHALAVPVGGAHGASTMTTVLVLAGVLSLYRRRACDVTSESSRVTLVLMIAPLGLGLAAAAVGRYPYGGSARTMQYAAGPIAILAGIGATTLLGRLKDRGRRRRLYVYGLVGLALLGGYEAASDVIWPYKIRQDEQAREFARRFWSEQARSGATVACAHDDLGMTLDPRHWSLGRTAVYRCNRRIYGPEQRADRPPPVDPTRPLRCVVYNEKADDPGLLDWVASMERRHALRRIRQYTPIPRVILSGHAFEDRYMVYEFEPSGIRVARSAPDSSTRK